MSKQMKHITVGDCGCSVLQTQHGPLTETKMLYCPKHTAADVALAACAAFEEAWEKSRQLEKTDQALAMAKKARAISEGRGE